MKFNHRTWVFLSAFTWFFGGVMLMKKGIGYISAVRQGLVDMSVIGNCIQDLTSSREQTGLVLICIALLIGFFKGRVVFSKSVSRVVSRIYAQDPPVSILNVYSPSYVCLLLAMMSLGIFFKWISIPYDIKGLIDIAIGSALVNGSFLYLRDPNLRDKSLFS